MQNKPNFPEPQMNPTVYFTRNYENNPALWLRQNKANQTQFPKRQEMNTTVYFTRNYENQPPRGSKPNQTRARITPNALKRLAVTL
jgi:hypothetical protein